MFPEMKSLKWITTAAALVLMVGCERNSNTASGEREGLRPTGRDTNAASRLYSDTTNAADDAYSRATNRARGLYSDATNQAGQLRDTNAVAPDNTGRNERDRDESALTPGDQGSSESDRETTRQIRRALTSNDQLSAAAKNIKIITVNGTVTLRGVVKTAQEKQLIDATVQQLGVTPDDQLEVK
jgi:osmotically-inducible protein OsmY